jgi:nitrogen fixation protein NifB
MSIIDLHPCFQKECSPSHGRIHLPVSPVCNISCRFCGRGITQEDPIPGNTKKVLNPEEALDLLGRALVLCPELRVAGVAGPGDPLASPEAIETLTLVKEKYPFLINCLSTNGLALYDSMAGLLAAGISTLTVTINALNPKILYQLNEGVIWQGQWLTGLEGAARLIENQEKGIRLALENQMIIKVNMVLAPDINDGHVEEVAKTVAGWGVSLFNIIPLLPRGGLSHLKAPTAAEVERAAKLAEKHIAIMRHCRRCRADACGIPGLSDFSQELYKNFNPVETFSHG